ncbi:DNA mismatch repair protein MutS [Ructibacterium gallinarum]|uniref:DNA mismatch repair protein MutS n=1 Tax=Ructibacterium gallinarum TaxID=2779355 RepID=A0A9D5M5Z1_9FIRM|nr:DNA mismatch repair protein MutS [Ructibacterium gallinarum]MBE5040097.1 DNA mismatch repair protein MutS [Ructibacterium gallinarum]
MDKLTPMMQQYFAVKNEYKDCILLYRLGDFYEMFFDDAMIASKVLDITLTGRNCGLKDRAPMCGVPFHAVDGYVARLVAAGYSAAICEQAEDPASAKGIVKREVIRVVTPGTIMDSAALDANKNNYLCSLCVGENGSGIAFVDITTGECTAKELAKENFTCAVMNELAKFMPIEVIMNLRAYENTGLVQEIRDRTHGVVRNYYDWAYEEEAAKKKVTVQFGSLQEASLQDKPNCVCAIGALLLYLEETQKTELKNLKQVEVDRDAENMQLDMYSLRNLEILETLRERSSRGSLLHVLNKTRTSMGSRLLRKWLTAPLMNCAAIANRHVAVDELVKDPLLRAEIVEALKKIADIERLINRIVYKNAGCADLTGLKISLQQLPDIARCLEDCQASLLRQCLKNMDVLEDIAKLIDTTIDENAPATLRNGGLILPGANEELDKTRNLMVNGKAILNELVEKEKEKTGIKTLKLGYNKVFGYYVEATRMYADKIPDYFIRKQTLANTERYITPELKEVEEAVLDASTKSVDMEYELFCQVRDQVGRAFDRVQRTAEAIAVVDVLCSFAAVAEKNGYVMPEVNMGDKISIKDGRHPVVEQLNKDHIFIPNDVILDNRENQVAIITGPNMAGKSTYMRQTALIVLMAQAGSFVPARQAEIGIVDRIFTRVGASDDLSAGQSTFMVEMNEVAYILDNATSKSLVILDEIGRGTSTFDGLGIAWAVAEYMADSKKCGAKTMFATHYHELTQLEDKIPNVKNYCIAVKKRGDSISFLRKIIRGGADESYGVDVAALAGVKKSVVRRAREIVASLESEEKSQVQDAKIHTKIPEENGNQAQMNFLGAAENPVLTELKALDLNVITPVEALTKLYDLQAKAKNQ